MGKINDSYQLFGTRPLALTKLAVKLPTITLLLIFTGILRLSTVYHTRRIPSGLFLKTPLKFFISGVVPTALYFPAGTEI